MSDKDLNKKPPKDSLFASPLGEINRFTFDQAVVDVFPDMIKRSVPGYESIIAQSSLLAARYTQPNSALYDLGSSLGATSIAMRTALTQCPSEQIKGCEIHAIDNAPAMIQASKSIIAQHAPKQIPVSNLVPVILHEANLEDHPIENASVVAMNFTLQFVSKKSRGALMQKIADALRPGGALILSEKVCFEDPTVDKLHIDSYHAFKSANGYSELEISQKRTALENVLLPDTLNTHQQRLLDAGFDYATVWFQCFNFASLIALKR